MKAGRKLSEPERVKVGLAYCSEKTCVGSKCPYCARGVCRQSLAKDALEVISDQHKEIERMALELEKAREVIETLKIGGKKNG